MATRLVCTDLKRKKRTKGRAKPKKLWRTPKGAKKYKGRKR